MFDVEAVESAVTRVKFTLAEVDELYECFPDISRSLSSVVLMIHAQYSRRAEKWSVSIFVFSPYLLRKIFQLAKDGCLL